MKTKTPKYLVGIDEAGRGPLAGPVSVGVVVLMPEFNRRLLFGVASSKTISERKREEWFERALGWKKEGVIDYAVSLVGERYIDERGIVKAVQEGIKRSLNRLRLDPRNCLVLLDGSIKAPVEFTNQKTIIRGDEIEAVISLASIMAKVRRDRRIVKLAQSFPEYVFHKHKGYGTKEHYRRLKKHGLCSLHRRSFCKTVVVKKRAI